MGGFVLNSQTVLLCPHGGVVNHIPSTATAHRVAGSPPMLLSDTYVIAGCGSLVPHGLITVPTPCTRVQWVAGSPLMLVRGSPVLTSQNTGICINNFGAPAGPVIIASHQTQVKEPVELTVVDD